MHKLIIKINKLKLKHKVKFKDKIVNKGHKLIKYNKRIADKIGRILHQI